MDNGIYAEQIKQKVKNHEEVSLDEAESYFLFSSTSKKELLEESRKEWNRVYRGLRRSYMLDRLKGAKRLDHLKYSLEYATTLKNESFENYQLLVDYAEYGFANPSIDGLRIYCSLSDYCDAYDAISTKFNGAVLLRNNNRELVSTILDSEDEVASLKDSGKDLLGHVRQIVAFDKEQQKRLVK